MTMTSRMITETSSSIVQRRLGDCRNHFSYFGQMRKALRRYPLYFRTVAFLTSAAFAALLIFTSSFFLSDYSSAARAAIGKLHLAQLSWIDQAPGANLSPSADAITELPALSIFDDQMILRNAGVNLDALKDGGQLKGKGGTRDALTLLQQIEQNLSQALEAKRFQVMFLQLASLGFLLFCLARLSIDTRRVLVDDVDRIVGSVSACESRSQSFPGGDEMARLEQSIACTLVRLECNAAHSASAAESRASLACLARVQDYLSKAIDLLLHDSFSDWMLRKVLYALERALELENTAIIFSESASALHSGRCLFSNREPALPTKEFYSDLSAAGAGTVVEASFSTADTRRAGVGFVDAAGELSVLLVEFSKSRPLDSFGIKTLRITASLLSMAAKLDGHDQESRRVAVMEERAAIARELHDSLAQSLSFMKIQLARLQSYQNDTSVEAQKQMKSITGDLRHGLDNAYRELRELLATFRVHMDVRGLDFAIEAAIEEFTRRCGLPISLDNRLVGAPLTVNEEFHVLHVVREALSNILHHAHANNVWIVMALQGNGTVIVTIDDDGVGYHPAGIKESSHHGQTIMKERAFSLGGTINVGPRRSGGTRVKLKFTPKKSQWQ